MPLDLLGGVAEFKLLKNSKIRTLEISGSLGRRRHTIRGYELAFDPTLDFMFV